MTVRQLLQAFARALPPDQHMDMPADARGLDTVCAGVTHDSRRVGPGFVYVALRGLKADGADFAPAAIAAGAAAVVVERRADAAVPRDWVTVTGARLALALLSAEFFAHPSRQLPVVGVTGTNGKTTTAYLINAIFDAAGMKSGLMGTVAYRIGDRELTATRTTPEAPELQGLLRQMVDAGCRACVMEVSSHALALRRADGIRFAAGVFTNLTRDHLDFHDGMEDYFAAKRRLFELLPADAPALINADDPRAAALIETAGRPITYGINKPADVSPGPLSYSMNGLEFDVRLSWAAASAGAGAQGAKASGGRAEQTVHVRSRLVGKPNVYNILAAVGTAAALGVPLDAIERGLAQLPGVPGRFEVVSGPDDDVVVVVDYAHTDDALRNLLETARPLASRGLTTVFGAGGDRDRTKRPLMGMVAARISDAVIITSDNPRGEDPLRIIEEVRRGAEPEVRTRNAVVHAIADRREAIQFAIDQAAAGDVVLIAGKGHEKYQEVAGEVHPFDDVTVARDALDARRVRSRVR